MLFMFSDKITMQYLCNKMLICIKVYLYNECNILLVD